MNHEEIHVQIPDDETIRVDRFIASLGLFSRSQIGKRSVRVRNAAGQELKFSRQLKNSDEIVLEWEAPPPSEIKSEFLELKIVYEDAHCVVINKDQGVVVHPACGHMHGTLVQALLYRYKELGTLFEGDRIRPGIVHRLDKDTSGVIIAAKNPETLEFLSEQFRKRTVKKTYLAIVKGTLPFSQGDIDAPIGRDPRDRKRFATRTAHAKNAHTRYRVLAVSGGYSLVQLRILTGRTHQIRVHLKSLGTPILGDPLYSRGNADFPEASLMLHAWKLTIHLPEKGKHRFKANCPPHFNHALSKTGIETPQSESDV